jgi:hypothetical protein
MQWRVEDLPMPVDHSLYREAVDAYLELSHKHIHALYVFGTVAYPGLSDLDVLVVPKNNYLAPLGLHLNDRLPRRFDPIIEHEVFVVPQAHLRASAYIYPGPEGFRLVYGTDVLRGVAQESSPSTNLCETVEFVHNKLVFLARLRRTGVLRARSCVRVFNSHRYNVRRLAALGLMEENGYATTFDALRAQLMARPSEEVVFEMYRAFERSVYAAARALRVSLDLDPTSVGQVAAVAQGRVSVPFAKFQIRGVMDRAEILTSYLQALVERNYWYGFPFLARLFPTPAANPLVERLLCRSLRSGLRRWRRLERSHPTVQWVQRLGAPAAGPTYQVRPSPDHG